MHCNAKQGRIGSNQGNSVIKTRVSCNPHRIFHVTGKNSTNYRITLLSSQDFPAYSLFYPVRHFIVETSVEVAYWEDPLHTAD
jgi:hypothetical protein